MRELKITNTLTRQKEVFRPLTPGKVKFYTCGPTTYNFLHVGNGRAAVTADIIYRTFKVFGYDVTYVRNFTDVDDKIIESANEQKISAQALAARFVEECRKDYSFLGMVEPTHTPKVTETMPEIIAMVDKLVKQDFAYVVNGEVLYDVTKKPDYLKLSKKNKDDLLHGVRVNVDKHKQNPADFVLWKPAKPGEPSWDSPWGAGRPGWHIECSAMAKKYLGDSIDLHHGGLDLIFPHHENEIAQSEAANGCPFCNTWAHNEFLNMGTEKMSKSLGNVVTLRAFCEKFSGVILRQIYLSAHYRSVLVWSDEAVERAINDVERLAEFWIEFQKVKRGGREASEDELRVIEIAKEKIFDELANDFNAPGALGHLFALIRDIRRDYLLKNEIPYKVAEKMAEVAQLVQKALGVWEYRPEDVLNDIARIKKSAAQEKHQGANLTEDEILSLIEQRKQAKASKNWALADQVRNTLKAKGIVLKDNPDGSISYSYESV